MTLTLNEDLFENGEYRLQYGLKTAIFSIIDEEFTGITGTAKIDRMLCTIQTFDETGEKTNEELGSLVIGLGDKNIAVTSDDDGIRGKLMTKDNMELCVVELYE